MDFSKFSKKFKKSLEWQGKLKKVTKNKKLEKKLKNDEKRHYK